MVSPQEILSRNKHFFTHNFRFVDFTINRYSTVQKTLLKENSVFIFEDGLDSEQMFGLVVKDLTQIKPNYEAMVKGGTLRITDEGYAQGKHDRKKRTNETNNSDTTKLTKSNELACRMNHDLVEIWCRWGFFQLTFWYIRQYCCCCCCFLSQFLIIRTNAWKNAFLQSSKFNTPPT